MEIKKEELKYVDDDIQKGVVVDWKKVFKYYDLLGCPKNVYNPSKEFKPESARWHILISTRSTGKTTNIILIGMILYLMYGIKIMYVRQREEMVTKQNMDRFLSVILKNDYNETLTNGAYTGVYYYGHKMYFTKTDPDTGKVIKSDDYFLRGLGINKHQEYKSTVNEPFGNFIVFDEFISTAYDVNEFVNFCQLTKTLFRDKISNSCIIIMLANSTDYYNQYLLELCIQDECLKLTEDKPFVKLTPLGTKVFVHLIGNRNTQRKLVNTLFYGFPNAKLASITGGGWEVKNYQHIERDDERLEGLKGIYLYYNGRKIGIELTISPTLGKHCIVHPVTRFFKPKRIYTIEDITKKEESFKFGCKPIDKTIWKLYNANRWYFSDNDTGYAIESYVSRANKL